MTLTVRGTFDLPDVNDVPYLVQIGDPIIEFPVGDPERWAHVTGSQHVRGLLRLLDGHEHPGAHTGPLLALTPGDPRAVLAMLAAETEVTEVIDTAPRRLDVDPAAESNPAGSVALDG